ncbi:MAG: enoyl-CoA hydratase-related protein, partial [Cyanobacteriota bacterium]
PKDPEKFNFNEIIYTKNNWVATVTINRAHVYNSYNLKTLKEMILAFEDASIDDSIAVVVLTGAGDKAFCTGGDVKEYANNYLEKPRNFWKWMNVYIHCHDLLRNMGKPVIARLNGMVVGGGNEFNMSCDLAIAAKHVEIFQVGTKVGSVAAGGATQFLPIFIGDRRAREMLFLNEPITATKALEWGLINKVVPYEKLDEAVDEMCQKLINKFPECMRYTKQQTNFWKDFSWHMTVGHARDWLSLHFASLETHEGMSAFVNKKPVDYINIRERAKNGQSSERLWGSNSKQCKNCNTDYLPDEFKFCGICGTELE